MKEATLEQTAVDIEANTPRKEMFRANGQTVIFDGFIRVYTEGRDDDANATRSKAQLPKLEKEMALALASAEENPAASSTSPNRRRATPTPRS